MIYRILTLCLLALGYSAVNASAFSLWKTCIQFDTSPDRRLHDVLSHHIVNADTLSLWNEDTLATATVTCPEGQSRHAFSNHYDGEPLFPDSSVRFPADQDTVCEGSTVYVYEKKCQIVSMTKEKRPQSP